MSSDEIDAFRAEMLRQKIIFEAELRRQREGFEEQMSVMSKQLADREADCRNLQAVVTILGKKIDILSAEVQQQKARRPATPVRSATPTRGLISDNPPSARGERAGSALGRRPSPLVPASSPSMKGLTTGTVSLRRVPSLNVLSRTNSPARAGNPSSSISSINGTVVPGQAHPHRASAAGTPSSRRRTGNGSARGKLSNHRLQDVTAEGDW